MLTRSGLSLVIPTYNRADLVGETITSALQQLAPFAEIVVVDDGSKDDTPQVLASFGDRIRVIRTENQGVQAARNTGIRATSTDLVALCDSDDLLEPAFAFSVLRWVDKRPQTDVLYCNFRKFNSGGREIDMFSQCPDDYFEGAASVDGGYYNIPHLFERNLKFQPFYASGVVVRRSFFEHIGPFDTAFRGVGAEDWEFTLRAILRGRVAALQTPLVRIRRHEGNDSADPLYMALGEARVLEHALQHHLGARRHAAAISVAIKVRLRGAFDEAYARGKLALAREIWHRQPSMPTALSQRTKYWISSLPAPLGKPLWQLSQTASEFGALRSH